MKLNVKKNVENEMGVETIIHGLSGGFEYNLTHIIFTDIFLLSIILTDLRSMCYLYMWR